MMSRTGWRGAVVLEPKTEPRHNGHTTTTPARQRHTMSTFTAQVARRLGGDVAVIRTYATAGTFEQERGVQIEAR